MKDKVIIYFEAIVVTMLLIGTIFLVPVSSSRTDLEKNLIEDQLNPVHPKLSDTEVDLGPFVLDRKYYIEDPEPATLDKNDFDDAGHRRDAGDKISRGSALYPGEMIDNTPGRGRTGKLSSGDNEDWFFFSACQGQNIQISVNPPSGYDFDLALFDGEAVEKETSTNSGSSPEQISFTADSTGYWFIQILYIDGSDEGQYSFDVTLSTQNDIDTGGDAGDSFEGATIISPGNYDGYLDMDDEQDWYKFQANAGDGIHFNLEMKKSAYLSDFDISLYNPSGEFVYEEDYYYDDELIYPADESGMWRAKIDIFPGYTDIPEPTEWEYFTYGSGAYNLEFSIDSSAPAIPGPIPQPHITPIAKTFNIAYDPDSNQDEYGYLCQ